MLPADVVQAAREGDRAAKDKLAVWMMRLLMPYFKQYFNDMRSMELFQETAADVFKNLRKKSPEDPTLFREWVYGYAWNEVRELRGKAKALRIRVLKGGCPEPEPPRGPGPETTLRNKERNAIASRCVELLPDVYRDALLHVADGGTYRTLAVAAQISEGAARKRIHDARSQLRTLVRKARRTEGELLQSPLV